jgi:membrane-bound lytic murein transglycosylase D
MKQPKYRLPLLCGSAILLGLQGCAQHSAKPDSRASGFSDSAFQSLQSLPQDAASDDSNAHESLWQRVFDMYALPTFEHEAIDREMAWFVNHPDYIARVQERAGIYLHSIVEQMDRQDVPGEIALLPVVESAFRPEAYSPKDAAGLWQFIPSTGRMYGLKQNHWYDGRRDVYESTQAAIRYLKKLHGNFGGDWLLALAAYNAGEGAVSRAIKRNQDQNKPTDFWSLASLPQETKTYVPRLLAVARLFANAADYDLTLRHIPNKATLAPVAVGPRLDLQRAATMADISVEELQTLNPGFSRGSTGPEEQTLLIPVEKSDTFKEQLARLDWNAVPSDGGDAADGLASGPLHMVRHGETLARIAQMYGTSEPAIRRANHLSPGKLRSGAQLLIPSSEKAIHRENMQEYQQEIAVAPSAAPGEQRISYMVHKGDTLHSVAHRFGVSEEMVKRWNHLKSDTVQAGANLLLWSKAPAKGNEASVVAGKNADKAPPLQAAGKPANKQRASVLYTVRGGDTLNAIARHFSVSVDDLRKWNTARLGKAGLRPGVVLMVYRES